MIALLCQAVQGLQEAYASSIVWPRLWRALAGVVLHGPETIGREGTIAFLHSQAHIAALALFVPTPEAVKARHQALAGLFARLSEEAAVQAGERDLGHPAAAATKGMEEKRYRRLLRKKTYHQRHADAHLDVLVAARVRPPTGAGGSVVSSYGRQAILRRPEARGWKEEAFLLDFVFGPAVGNEASFACSPF